MPNSAIDAGSGIFPPGSCGMPGTFTPAVVPKEKVALVMLVAAVTLATFTVNVAVWFRNGLWGPLPAMELFAAV